MNNIDNGSLYIFFSKWNVWIHPVSDTNWKIESYKKIYTISNISEFWLFLNNFKKLDYKNYYYYIMRDGINPMWEDPKNINGGICSFKLHIDKFMEVWIMLCMHTMNETLIPIVNDITGINFNPKNNCALLKIWNKNKNNNISNLLNPDIILQCNNVSIQYKAMDQS